MLVDFNLFPIISILQATSITRSSISGDHMNDSIGGTLIESGSKESLSKRKSASQKSKPKKRKLHSVQEEYDEEEQADNDSKSSSRSRCF